MKNTIRKIAILFVLVVLACLWVLGSASVAQAQMAPLDDDELSQVDGQALLDIQKETTNGFTFYTVGLDATVNLNLNIQRLQLGCNGINGSGCDLDLSNVSFGCGVASTNGTGPCITPTSSGGSGGTVNSLAPFILDNPFLQIAIQNDGTPTLRSLAGIRLGASNISGALSVGSFNSFSGYFSGSANISMNAQNDVAVTCGASTAPCTGTAQSSGAPNNWSGSPACGSLFVPSCYWLGSAPTANGANQFGYNAPAQSLGLNDDFVCAYNLLIYPCIQYDVVTVNYNGVSRPGSPVVVAGNRVSQAQIQNVMLGDDVNAIVNSLKVNQCKSCSLPTFLLNALIGEIQPAMENNVDNQLASGLGLTTSTNTATVRAELNAYNIPYNLSNVHQLNISAGGFGLSFENQPIAYPGYVNASGAVQTVPAGWAMYATNAFTLTVSQPTTLFVNNIATGAARAGNIVGLPGPYTNCYGSATFC